MSAVMEIQEETSGHSISRKRLRDSDDGVDETRPMSSTCNHCRDRKVKCDGNKPCGTCTRSSVECIYRQRKKPGIRPGMGDVIETEVARLRERIEQLEQWQLTFTMMSATPTSGLTNAEAHGINLSSSHLPAFGVPILHDLVNAAASATLPQHQQSPASLAGYTNQQQAYAQLTGESSLQVNAARFSDRTTAPENGRSTTVLGISELPAAPSVLPSDHVVRSLVVLFYQNIVPCLPLFISTSPSDWSPPWSLPVYAMVVVSQRFCPDTNAQWRTRAREHVIIQAAAHTTIESLQALAILAYELMGSGSDPSEWSVMNSLIRSASALGLSKEDTSGSTENLASVRAVSVLGHPQSALDREIRRRLFWVAYALDRFSCAATGWQLGIVDSDIRVHLPLLDSSVEHEHSRSEMFRSVLHSPRYPNMVNGHNMAHLIQALDLLTQSHKVATRIIDFHDERDANQLKYDSDILAAALTRTRSAMTSQVGESDTDTRSLDPMILLTRATYNATMLRLSARFAYASDRAQCDEISRSRCTDVVNSQALLCKQIIQAGRLSQVSPLFIWCTWVAARVAFVHSYTLRQSLGDEFSDIRRLLRESGEFWHSAAKYADLLDKAVDRWQRQDLRGGSSHDSQTVSVLLDMRSTAYSALAGGSRLGTPAEPANGHPTHDARGMCEQLVTIIRPRLKLSRLLIFGYSGNAVDVELFDLSMWCNVDGLNPLM